MPRHASSHVRPAGRRVLSAALTFLALCAVVFVLSRCTQSAAPRFGTAPDANAPTVPSSSAGLTLTLATWNVRGHPEKAAADNTWFHETLARLGVDVLCVQEIAGTERARELCAADARLTHWVCTDSTDAMDNAIVAVARVALVDLPDPGGFQHPAQAAYVTCGGFDAVVVTVHLSWKDEARRAQEADSLAAIVRDAQQRDPDVLLAGDFNMLEPELHTLADRLGLTVLDPAGQEGVGTTHKGNRYDYFLATPDLASEETLQVHIVTFFGPDLPIAQRVSDHLPVMATFRTDEAFRDRPQP